MTLASSARIAWFATVRAATERDRAALALDLPMPAMSLIELVPV